MSANRCWLHLPVVQRASQKRRTAGKPTFLTKPPRPAREVAQRQVALVGPALCVAAHELLLVGHTIGDRQAQGCKGLAIGDGQANYAGSFLGLTN